MKRILLGVFAFIFAAATVFAAQVNQPATVTVDPVYHWFEGEDFIGEGTEDEMRQFCNELAQIECLAGYDPSVGETRPTTGTPVILTKN